MIHMGGRTDVRPLVIIFRPIPTPQKKLNEIRFLNSLNISVPFWKTVYESLWKTKRGV